MVQTPEVSGLQSSSFSAPELGFFPDQYLNLG